MKVYLILNEQTIIAYSNEPLNGAIEIEIDNPKTINLGTDTFENGVVVQHSNTAEENKLRIIELKQKLAATDYYCLKYVDGELSEEEYAPIKAQRQAYRSEINQLEAN